LDDEHLLPDLLAQKDKKIYGQDKTKGKKLVAKGKKLKAKAQQVEAKRGQIKKLKEEV